MSRKKINMSRVYRSEYYETYKFVSLFTDSFPCLSLVSAKLESEKVIYELLIGCRIRRVTAVIEMARRSLRGSQSRIERETRFLPILLLQGGSGGRVMAFVFDGSRRSTRINTRTEILCACRQSTIRF